MSTFPITNGGHRTLPNQSAAMYLRALADEFANLSNTEIHEAEIVDWVAVEGAIEAVFDALEWIRS